MLTRGTMLTAPVTHRPPCQLPPQKIMDVYSQSNMTRAPIYTTWTLLDRHMGRRAAYASDSNKPHPVHNSLFVSLKD